MSEFLMPSLGADMKSAILMQWKVKVGDRVTKGQVIAEIETSKGVIEIEVFQDGIIEKILVEPETECNVGTPLALIRSDSDEENITVSSVTAAQAQTEAIPLAPLEKATPDRYQDTTPPQRIKASPAARKKARQLGLDLADLAKTSEGEIHLSQIESVAKTELKTPSADKMRQAIASAMSLSNAEIPHYYLSASVNMSPALSWLEEINKNLTIKARILPAAMIIRAVVLALEAVPELNGYWQEGYHQVCKEIHPGIAIALRKKGVITPALLGAKDMNLSQTMQALDDLIMRTRAGKLRGAELTQQSITITNLGDLGVENVYGVIYPPQVALIGLGKIIDTPWVQENKVIVQKVMKATLAGDHRATDGRTGALFLDKFNRILQNPKELL
ncbi:dihydrolipoamide acetyltransferase family protein [Desulfobacter postgatei]|jgi:pyruvate dehydrogenase E2 component (dihydrolipoamide acetyltransferase)|uniref:dihydrolipoamide acetyltransferase family protein n=1 Tax=Desulfobacter postgatei TaxID=2293 RepID=UPI002A36BD0D|nr:dihydrolipoamide acetyltransferase family protein [Desulfobacter postgatei]MDX9963668.1 dihydrolipoamide acetyltransferase family protein [Desulfobacter postgatei]